jgi:pSer/pThr/pTyr-binding forkhead associated (FHA) protein
VDQVSGNGTFVNGKRVTVSYLHSGDRIAFGPAEGVFQAPGAKTGSSPAAASVAATPMDARRKRGLLIAGLSFLGTVVLIVVLLKWLA